MSRRRVRRVTSPGTVDVALSGGGTASLPGDAVRAITSALLPSLTEHGTVSLTLGTPREQPERPAGLIPGSGRRGPGRALDQVVSVRFGTPLLSEIRRRAGDGGISVSDWLRIAAGRQIAAEDEPAAAPLPAGLRIAAWSCPHVTMTIGGVAAASVTGACGQGCEMQPAYDAA